MNDTLKSLILIGGSLILLFIFVFIIILLIKRKKYNAITQEKAKEYNLPNSSANVMLFDLQKEENQLINEQNLEKTQLINVSDIVEEKSIQEINSFTDDLPKIKKD